MVLYLYNTFTFIRSATPSIILLLSDNRSLEPRFYERVYNNMWSNLTYSSPETRPLNDGDATLVLIKRNTFKVISRDAFYSAEFV